MTDRLIVVIIWFLSIGISIRSIVQTRGKDWYAPITSKQKMVMTIINASILFMVIVCMYDALLIEFSKTLIISLVTLIIILFFINPPIVSTVPIFFGKRNRQSGLNTDVDIPTQSAEEKNTLKEYLQRFITVFNCAFFVSNSIYVFYIMKTGENLMSYHSIVVEARSQIVSATVLFWLTLTGTIITSKDWKYTDVVIKRETQVKKDANYHIRRIISRNR